MHTLVIASQKGGSGKTTLSGHLAVEAEAAGAGPVALIDTDPQGSLAEWWNVRKSPTPAFVKVASLELEDTLATLQRDGFKLVIVDTPPAIVGAIAKVVSCADLVLIPTRPSPHDLRSVGATVEIAERAHKALVFVVNDATLRARITSETAIALSQHGTVAPVTIHNRVDFAASMVDGRTVGEVVPQSKSAEEVRLLWKYIAERLSRAHGENRFTMESRRLVPRGNRPSLIVEDDPERDALLQNFSETALLSPPMEMAASPVPEAAAIPRHTPLAMPVPPKPASIPDPAIPVPPMPAIAKAHGHALAGAFDGLERRVLAERRAFDGGKTAGLPAAPKANFSPLDRRAQPFGRRRSDQAF